MQQEEALHCVQGFGEFTESISCAQRGKTVDFGIVFNSKCSLSGVSVFSECPVAVELDSKYSWSSETIWIVKLSWYLYAGVLEMNSKSEDISVLQMQE